MTTVMIDRSTCSGTSHGTSNDYRNHGCRCPDAAQDNTRYGKRRRAGLHRPGWVSSVGVVRRRQALAVMGYGLRDLAPFFGTSWRGVGNYLARPHVHRSTFERWVEVYDRLSMTPGPNVRAREYARKLGWAPPLAWDDDEIDTPDAVPTGRPRPFRAPADLERVAAALAGDPAARRALTTPDRMHIVQSLHAEGAWDVEIVERSGIALGTVRNLRTRLGLGSPYLAGRKQAG